MRAPRSALVVAVLVALLAIAIGSATALPTFSHPARSRFQVSALGPRCDHDRPCGDRSHRPRPLPRFGTVHRSDSRLSPGSYELQLEGLSANCRSRARTPRQVTVAPNRITVITFTMACTRRVGTVRITTITTGTGPRRQEWLHGHGWSGGIGHAIGANGTTLVLPGVDEGSPPVTLNGVAPNCTVAGGTTVTTVSHGETSEV